MMTATCILETIDRNLRNNSIYQSTGYQLRAIATRVKSGIADAEADADWLFHTKEEF